MAEYPIIMSGDSVRATLEKRKAQTRRVINERTWKRYRKLAARAHVPAEDVTESLLVDWSQYALTADKDLTLDAIDLKAALWRLCPYGQPGDRLWVRERWAQIYTGEGCVHEDDREGNEFCPCPGCRIEYRAGTDSKYPGGWADEAGDDAECPRWRSPIHMPRRASRITLEVVSVRAEWLQDITVEGVEAEGLNVVDALPPFPHTSNGARLSDEKLEEFPTFIARALFQKHWDAINAKRGYPWSENPPVWAIEYRLVEECE